MKVSYSKDLANHAGPEPHGVCGNAIADALEWENVGGTLSSENTTIRVPTLWSVAKMGQDGKGYRSFPFFYPTEKIGVRVLSGDWNHDCISRAGRKEFFFFTRHRFRPPHLSWTRLQKMSAAWRTAL